MTDRELMLKVAWNFLGTPYIWGGDDPSGFDCSGFVIECLQSVGLLPRQGDWTAGQLWEKFSPGKRLFARDYRPGDLAFWYGKDKKSIIHIEILVDGGRSIGAQGGGSTVLDTVEAWRRNSYVKVRPFATRPDMAGVLNPFYYVEAVQTAVA